MALGRNPLLDKTNQSQSRVGSGFTNLQRVLDANKQNRLGQTLATGVGNLAEQNKQAVGQAQNQFQTQSEAGRLDTAANTQFRNTALDKTRTGQDVTDQDAERFQQLQIGQYAGPQNLQNVDSLKDQANQVQQLGTYATDANKTKGLLQKFVGSPRYSLGQKTLDSTILGQDPNVARNIRQQTVGVSRGINRASNAAQAQSLELGNRAKAFNDETKGMLGNEATNYDTTMAQRATEGTANRNALIEKAKQQLAEVGSSGTVSKDVADALGLTEGQSIITDAANPIYGTGAEGYSSGRNMADYYQYNPLEANKQSIQSSQDFTRINALKKLGGGSAGADANNVFNQYLDPNQVGSFAGSKIANFDQNAYNDDLKRRGDYLNSDIYKNQVGGFQETARDIEGRVFGNWNGETQPKSFNDILNRKASALSQTSDGGAANDIIAELVKRKLQTNPDYNNALATARNRATNTKQMEDQARVAFLNDPAVKQALQNGTVKDLLSASGTSTDQYRFANADQMLNAPANLSLEQNLSKLADRYNVIQNLQNWAAGKKLKIT